MARIRENLTVQDVIRPVTTCQESPWLIQVAYQNLPAGTGTTKELVAVPAEVALYFRRLLYGE